MTSKRGRPPFQPTDDQRMTVEQLVFCGEDQRTIARAIGIDPDTLRKHFAEELTDGHARRREEVIYLLFEAARAKNVSALKRLEEMGRTAAVESKPKAEKFGKKETAKLAARRITGKFAPPAPPKLVVNNR